MEEIWAKGYSSLDIITTIFRVVKNYGEGRKSALSDARVDLQEYLKLEYIRVSIAYGAI